MTQLRTNLIYSGFRFILGRDKKYFIGLSLRHPGRLKTYCHKKAFYKIAVNLILI